MKIPFMAHFMAAVTISSNFGAQENKVCYCCYRIYPRASLIAQLVKNLPAMQETWVQFLGWEDALEKVKVTHSSILAWRIP